MITNTHPQDYQRRYRPETATQREENDRIRAWVLGNIAYYKRGLLTMPEFHMLVDRGPKKESA
jgi:hypothetical protein